MLVWATTVLSTYLGKTYFAWRFILNENILFWLTISYQKPFVFFCFCVLFSNMYPKIKFIAKYWSDLCNFYSKVIFWNFCLSKYFYFSLPNLKYWLHNNIVKLSEKMNKLNLLKICLQVTYRTNFCILQFSFMFTMGKSWNNGFYKNHWLEWIFCA